MPFIGQQPTTGAFLELDSLTASATADYTLQLNGANYYPESVNNLLVSINGVIQGSSTMSLNGSTLTVGATLSSSDVIDFVRVFGNVGTISTPTDGSVTTNKIGTGAVTDAKIATMSSSKLTGALPSSVTSSGIYLGGTGSANLLDDYEEGTWTPAYTASATAPTITYADQAGSYVKVGDLVHVQGRLRTNSTSGGGGNVLVTGLPFTNINQGNHYSTLHIAYTLGWAADKYPTGGLLDPNTSNVRLYTAREADYRDGVGTVLTAGNLTTGSSKNDIIFSMTYRAN